MWADCDTIYVPEVYDITGCKGICDNSRACECYSYEKDTGNCYLKQVMDRNNRTWNIFCQIDLLFIHNNKLIWIRSKLNLTWIA